MLKNLKARLGVIGELMEFLWTNKKWWLIPIVILLILFLTLLVLSSNPVVAPFIYTIF
jgi:hypothetical protein